MVVKENDRDMVIEVDRNGVVLRKIDRETGEDQLISTVMAQDNVVLNEPSKPSLLRDVLQKSQNNRPKTKTEKRVEKLLRRPTIQKLFEG